MIYNSSNIDKALAILKDSPEEIWSIDLETYNPYENAWFMDLSAKQRPLNRINSKIVSLQLSTESGIEMYFDFNHRQDGDDLRLDYKYLESILEQCKSGDLIAHNAAFEYGMILRHGYKCPQNYYDTMIMGVLYNENMPQGLKPTIKHRFGHVMPSYQETVGEGTMADISAEEGYDYGMSDTLWTLKLYQWLLPKINMAYYEYFEMDLIKIISEHYAQGQQIDKTELDRIMLEDMSARDVILDEFPKLGELNMNSPKQISNWLFNDMALPPVKVSKKTGVPSTDKETLFELESEFGNQYPIIKAFGDVRRIETRLKLYYKPYPKLIYPDGLIHSEIRQTGTVTGRFSMNSPNLQQVSKRGEGVKVRNVFVPFSDRGHDCIVCIDWSQIEMRVAAHMSEDPKLLDGYRTNKDMHTLSGTNISGLPYDEMKAAVLAGDKAQKANRQKGKTLNFAALYLAGAKRLSAFDLLDCAEAEADEFLSAHKIGYKGYFYDYVNKVMATLRENKYVTSLFGRVRRLPDIASPIGALRKSAENQGLNHTIQGTAGEFMKAGLNTLYAEGMLFEPDRTFIAPVHDEYVFSADSKKVHEWLSDTVDIMERTPEGFLVPLIAEASIGPNFGAQEELNGDFSEENIAKTLAKGRS